MIAASPPQVSGLFGVPPFSARQAKRQPLNPAPAIGGTGSLVATPEQEAMTARLSRMYPAPGPLGASMRQPFDYTAAYNAIAGDQRQPSRGQMIAGSIGDALASVSGGRGSFLPNLMQQREVQQARLAQAGRALADWQHSDWARQNAADLDASAPFTIGRSRLQLDPSTGGVETLYTGPEDFDLYAEGMGLQPGSPEYFKAVEDYVLRSSGPSAHERDLQMDDRRTSNDIRVEGVRQDNRIGLEGVRQSNRVGLEGVRQGNRVTLRNMPPRPRAARSGGSGDMPVVNSPREAANLPPGTQFRTRDGRTMRVPQR